MFHLLITLETEEDRMKVLQILEDAAEECEIENPFDVRTLSANEKDNLEI